MKKTVSKKKFEAPEYRYAGSRPKVGIRPIIDGRKIVREPLENQTMAMARAAAKLITENLRHPDGAPVECVVPDFTIGGATEASRCTALFAKENVGVSLSVTPCWCYGSETMDQDPVTPKAVWGFNGTERPGAVYLSAVLAAHAQKGRPAFGIYGVDVQDIGDPTVPADVREKILRFVRAGLAAAAMRGKSYLSMGGVSMGIAGSIVDQNFFEEYLGMRCVSIDMAEFIRRVNARVYDAKEYELARQWVSKNCREGKDYNARKWNAKDKSASWDYVVKMAMIARDLMVGNPALAKLGFAEAALGHNAIAAGFQGQRQWSDHMPNGDFMETLLNSSFDWNGKRQPYILATENDSLNGISMLFGHLLTGTAQGFSDVRTYWSPAAMKRVTGKAPTGLAKNGVIHLINSGATTMDGTGRQSRNGKPVMKPYWEISDVEAEACLGAVEWTPANREYFPGGGFSSRFLTRGDMPLTLSRLNLVKGLGPVMQIAEGYTCELPKAVHDKIDLRTDPGWPTTYFVPRLTGSGAFASVYDVMANWGANHGAFSYGHIGADLIALCSMLRIPVCMHNVEPAQIYRPAVWSAFGMDKEGADFRACGTLGPLYR